MDTRDQAPTARTDGILVEEMDDETLVYDLETHGAHCLNPSAALVWKRCDGRTTVREMVPLLAEVGLPEDETLVWMALSRLDKAGLIGSVDLPGPKGRFSRKEVLRVVGRAAVAILLPAVTSVVAPTAAAAASCITLAACNALLSAVCPGLPICGAPTSCCKKKKGETYCQAQAC